MIILKNKYDTQIEFTNVKDAKNGFSIEELRIDNDYPGQNIEEAKIKLEKYKKNFYAAENLAELKNILNNFDKLFLNEPSYFLEER